MGHTYGSSIFWHKGHTSVTEAARPSLSVGRVGKKSLLWARQFEALLGALGPHSPSSPAFPSPHPPPMPEMFGHQHCFLSPRRYPGSDRTMLQRWQVQ